MNVNVLGGGPAGLYFSILHKKQNPASNVVVYERNAPDDTFGWGVVFSDETLGNLEEADPKTFGAIRKNFAYWDAIDLHVEPGTPVVRSGGHGFCGLGRRRLLELLQERATELGVEVHYQTEIDDIAEMRKADLLVAADGLNSKVRALYPEAFGPSVVLGDSRFIWLGTHQTFEAFTFIFRQNDHGTFQVHAYQFDKETSTFIVECDAETYARAGFEVEDGEAAARYFEKMFAPELGGHALLTNRSHWRRFPTVSCEHWCHENVVLIGDAAHTAHFSIGSGTKLAMEDSIELAAALVDVGPGQVHAALRTYDAERHGLVARIQKAASQSQRWFEEAPRHIALPAQRLMFSMMSRTRRVTHENLRLRDAAYIEGVDRDFQTEASLGDHDHAIPPMFTPFKLGDITLSNRVVVSPMCQYRAEDGVPTMWHHVHYGSRAIGGAGLVFSEMTAVSQEGRITPGCTGLYNDAQEHAWAQIVDFVHAETDAKMAIQLAHAGRKGATQPPWNGSDLALPNDQAWPLLAPSAVPWSKNNATPIGMDEDAMQRVLNDFVAAAKRAERVGFDVLEVHLAHGYLLSSFLSPTSNRREDEYGGSLQNRARYPLQVVNAVRGVWQGPLSVRISATDWTEDGFDIEDAVHLSMWLKQAGVDLVDVSAGQTTPDAKPVYGRAFQTPFAERIRNDVGIATMAVGNILDHDRVNTILAAGRADLVALARAHLANPYFTRHAAAALGHATEWPKSYLAAQTVAPRMYEPT